MKDPRKAELMKLSKGEIVERLLFAYNTISKLEKAVSHEKELFTREQVSKIVDYCFHKHASFYRGQDAEVAIEEAIKSSSKAVKE